MASTHEPTIRPRYLSRLRLNLRDRRVRQDLSNSQALHRRLLDAFPEATARGEIELLYRVEASRGGQSPEYIVLVQSGAEPDWSRLDGGYLQVDSHGFGWSETPDAPSKEISEKFRQIDSGDQFRFRLRANPTKKYHYKPGDVDKNGKPRRSTGPNGTRIPLLDDVDLRDWLVNKGSQHGFRVLGARWQPDPVTGDRQRGAKANGTSLTHYAVLFEGVLKVTDDTAFQDALMGGIGPGKAYGFGLLSLAAMNAPV